MPRPPSHLPASITLTFLPSLASSAAAVSPAAPAPMIATSTLAISASIVGDPQFLSPREARLGAHFSSAPSASRRPGSRLAMLAIASFISSRASWAPMHAWMPLPNAMCGFGARVMSKRSGSSNFSGSRFAAAGAMYTRSPALISRPRISWSSSVQRCRILIAPS